MYPLVKIINKKTGQTPLECINELKKADLKLAHLPITYAGRLDPLAEGVIIILIGDECLKKDEYLKLPKEYEVDILFGFATDTYDVMGKVKASLKDQAESKAVFETVTIPTPGVGKTEEFFDFLWSGHSSSLVRGSKKLNDSDVFKTVLKKFTGRIKQSYPPYSSRTVNGKPLFQWSREGKIDEIIIPAHDVFVEKIEILKKDSISGDELLSRIKKDISQVRGDFRQSEIVTLWENELENKKEEEYKIIRLKINCGSGFYVRALAHDIGIALGIPALALKIKRTKVGEYEVT